MSKCAIYPHDRTPSRLAAGDGLLLISERENKLPLSTANEKQIKQNTETVRRVNENLREQYKRSVMNTLQMIRRTIWNKVRGELCLAKRSSSTTE